jgi:hypothetical protein
MGRLAIGVSRGYDVEDGFAFFEFASGFGIRVTSDVPMMASVLRSLQTMLIRVASKKRMFSQFQSICWNLEVKGTDDDGFV